MIPHWFCLLNLQNLVLLLLPQMLTSYNGWHSWPLLDWLLHLHLSTLWSFQLENSFGSIFSACRVWISLIPGIGKDHFKHIPESKGNNSGFPLTWVPLLSRLHWCQHEPHSWLVALYEFVTGLPAPISCTWSVWQVSVPSFSHSTSELATGAGHVADGKQPWLGSCGYTQ